MGRVLEAVVSVSFSKKSQKKSEFPIPYKKLIALEEDEFLTHIHKKKLELAFVILRKNEHR